MKTPLPVNGAVDPNFHNATVVTNMIPYEARNSIDQSGFRGGFSFSMFAWSGQTFPTRLR